MFANGGLIVRDHRRSFVWTVFTSHEDQHVDTAETWAKIDLHVASNQRWIGLQISQFDMFSSQEHPCQSKLAFANFSWFPVTHLVPFLNLRKVTSTNFVKSKLWRCLHLHNCREGKCTILLLVVFIPTGKQTNTTFIRNLKYYLDACIQPEELLLKIIKEMQIKSQ